MGFSRTRDFRPFADDMKSQAKKGTLRASSLTAFWPHLLDLVNLSGDLTPSRQRFTPAAKWLVDIL